WRELKILVTGAGGLVGREVVANCAREGLQVKGLAHQSLDISNESQVNEIFDRERPDIVINCAAWTNVDGCESDPQHAERANGLGPELLAKACDMRDALLI